MPSRRQRSANQYQCRWYIGYKHAFDSDDESVPIRCDSTEEFLGMRAKILAKYGLAVVVDNVDLHRPIVQVAVVGVLTIVKVDHGTPPGV
jgi:hypothetical protein